MDNWPEHWTQPISFLLDGPVANLPLKVVKVESETKKKLFNNKQNGIANLLNCSLMHIL